jgi:hypothetical protein
MLNKLKFPADVMQILSGCKSLTIPKNRMDLINLTLGGECGEGNKGVDTFEVKYDVEGLSNLKTNPRANYDAGGTSYLETTLIRAKNGAVINYADPYMRRRDPACLIIGDDKPTDKDRFNDIAKERFGCDKDFKTVRTETFDWLKNQDLIFVPVKAGGDEYGYEAGLIAPKNAGFFATALADLQYFVNLDEHKGDFCPKVVIYLAPPFRHTHFAGYQVVMHNRMDELYELFAYNLYPGPSAKKGIYGFLLDIGEREGWVTAHTAAVKVITPYENEIVIMHEGASGGGKSEMSEHIHREPDGRIVIGENLQTHEKFYLNLNEPCGLHPVADDMALCHPKMQNDSGKLVIKDVEAGWFVRVDHIKQYGTDPDLEKACIHPKEPLAFMSMNTSPNSTCLIWEHLIDEDTNRPCPNPRVVRPRRTIDNIVNDPVEVDVRSFGVRTPPSTKENPNYGIMGMMQILPPALGWLWRLTAPRGHDNPSIVGPAGMQSEGIGSYGFFLTGSVVKQANLLLKQVLATPNTRYVLIPNQHIGCYKVGFMPQWIVREYISRRGSAKFKQSHLVPARLPLLGYCLDNMKIDGQDIRKAFLRPETQAELGTNGYDEGAKILSEFCKKELAKFNTPELDPLGKKILDCCLNDAPLSEYLNLIPMRY